MQQYNWVWNSAEQIVPKWSSDFWEEKKKTDSNTNVVKSIDPARLSLRSALWSEREKHPDAAASPVEVSSHSPALDFGRCHCSVLLWDDSAEVLQLLVKKKKKVTQPLFNFLGFSFVFLWLRLNVSPFFSIRLTFVTSLLNFSASVNQQAGMLAAYGDWTWQRAASCVKKADLNGPHPFFFLPPLQPWLECWDHDFNILQIYFIFNDMLIC